MVPLDFAENVFLDPASVNSWDELNETAFLRNTLAHLREIMGERFAAFSFFIFSPARTTDMPASAAIDGPGKVLIYISDESSHVPSGLSSRYHCIFKSYQKSDVEGPNIFAFNIGYVKGVHVGEFVPARERRFDVFFSGNLSRSRIPLWLCCLPFGAILRPFQTSLFVYLLTKVLVRLDLLLDFSGTRSGRRTYLRFTSGFKRGLSLEEYGRYLGDSRVVLCPRGFISAETFRHVEALRAGAAVVSEKLPDTRFYRGAPFVTVENWQQGLGVAASLAADPDRLASLQERGLAWYETVLSERATARDMDASLASLPPIDAPACRGAEAGPPPAA